jgi:hypothetical protein
MNTTSTPAATSRYGLAYDLYRAGLGQYTLEGLGYLAEDMGLTKLERQAVRDEVKDRLTAAANA